MSTESPAVPLRLPPSAKPAASVPLDFGIVIYSGFQALGVFDPLDALNELSLGYSMKLSVIAETMNPVSTKPPGSFSNPGSDFGQSITPTHTFDNAPPLDVLIIPGGFETRIPQISTPIIDYIARTYPSLKYLITVCTGSSSRLAAEAGILDGKRATTNKSLWALTTSRRPQVEWVAQARWVVDGNIWTGSGVSAGIDLIFAFIGEVYGEEVATLLANSMEYEIHLDSTWDPYAAVYSL